MSAKVYMGIPREEIAWNPTVDEGKCVGCGQCLEVCPNDVFKMDETANKMKVVNPTNCVVLCDKCKAFCDQDAISFPDKEATKRFVSGRMQAAAQQRKDKAE